MTACSERAHAWCSPPGMPRAHAADPTACSRARPRLPRFLGTTPQRLHCVLLHQVSADPGRWTAGEQWTARSRPALPRPTQPPPRCFGAEQRTAEAAGWSWSTGTASRGRCGEGRREGRCSGVQSEARIEERRRRAPSGGGGPLVSSQTTRRFAGPLTLPSQPQLPVPEPIY